MKPGPERNRRIWEMYYAEGMTLNAIGVVMGVTRERIRVIRNRYDERHSSGILRDLYLERNVLDNRISALRDTVEE